MSGGGLPEYSDAGILCSRYFGAGTALTLGDAGLVPAVDGEAVRQQRVPDDEVAALLLAVLAVRVETTVQAYWTRYGSLGRGGEYEGRV